MELGTLRVVERRGELQDAIDRALQAVEVFKASIEENATCAPAFAVQQRRIARHVKGCLVQAAVKAYHRPAEEGAIRV